ncbi:hypothetical protein J4N02_03185 [Propioniciclava sp. MC1595]|uniref:hypothetical protein n=1 Tax=Propioniciclava sp. MC1595 TaxID=2760308 RepID=UPI0016627BB8|nr:hypothetical protein [Propioniciclava sp. MC1595]MBB1495472.1 hypothetical protein [Propioniciclava sp. MC1595]QTE26635.1 hypothetical protein J4N02_03185 [Propioniciclava sp. MC1595]
MPNATTLEFWTLVIAVVGGVTGVAALATQVWSLILAGPRVKVTVATALLPSEGTWALSLDASNIGRLPVTLLEMGVTFRTRNGWQKAPVGAMPRERYQGPSAPHRLADAEAVTWILDAQALAHGVAERGAVNVYGYVRLATDKTIRSRRPIDVVSLAELR